MSKDPAAEIRLLKQRTSEELQAMRIKAEKNYQSPGMGGLWSNALSAGNAALFGFGGKMLSGFLTSNATVRNVIGIGIAAYKFISSRKEYRQEIREEAAAQVAHIDIILQARAEQGGQPTLQGLGAEDIARLRQGQMGQNQNLGQFTNNTANRGAGQTVGV